MNASCVNDDDGKIVFEEDKLMEVWRAHYGKISNEEFAWDRNSQTNVSPVGRPSGRISALEVGVAIGKKKQGTRETEQVASSSLGSVGYISHVHRAYDHSGPFGVLWLHMA